MLQRLTSIYLALLLTVFLLAFPPGGYVTIPEFKYSLFLLICGGYVATIAILRMIYMLTGTQPLGKIREKQKSIPIATKFLLGFLLVTIISSLFSVYPGTFRGTFRQEGVLTIGIYVLSCVFVSIYFRPKKWMLFLFGTVVGLVSTLALIQLTGANPFMLYPAGHNYYGANIYYSGAFLSTIGNAGLLGGFVSLAAGVLAMALIKFDFRERWCLALPFFLTVLLICSMDIDAAFLALAAGLILMLPIAVTGRKTLVNTLLVLAIVIAAFALSQILVFQDGPIQFAPLRVLPVIALGFVFLLAAFVMKIDMFARISTKQYRISATVAILGLFSAALTVLWRYSGESGMLYEAAEIMRGNWDPTFGTGRIYIWRSVLEHIRWETLLLGTGPDTLGFWDIPPFTRFDERLGVTIVTSIEAAHNEYLQILATGGLLSLLAYLGALFFAAVRWIRHPENALSAMAGAGILFYGIQAFFGISQFITAPFFWACFGILLYAQSGGEEAGASVSPGVSRRASK